MKRIFTFFISFFTLIIVQAKEISRPKLVVGIVVDQMRWDYLYRYYERYDNNGFLRLMNSGFKCEQTFINYLPSFTGSGHACIFTGAVPAIHGIAGNDWIPENGKPIYCVEDKGSNAVGGSKKAGQMSPRNLLTTTITDELRMATNFRSRVFGVSLKDRASILPAGHLANGAYWYDDSTGNFITSDYYQASLPEWLNNFNARKVPDSFLKANWNLLFPLKTYVNSLPDSNNYEGLNKGEKAPVFPHLTANAIGKDYGILRKIPAGNTATLLLAQTCITSEKLGQTNNTDFITINLAATDYTGHQYSQNSVEMEDVYLRLDKDLAGLLKFLDTKVGIGNYSLFLTADHGAAQNYEYLKDLKIPAGNLNSGSTLKELNAFLKKEIGRDSLVKSFENYQVYFEESRMSKSFTDRLNLQEVILTWLRHRPEVQFAINLEMNGINQVPQPLQQMAINGFFRGRSGSIQIIPAPGYYAAYAETGTTHGTWNPYDTHIPLLFYGWGIKKGSSNKETNMTDIAATLAALLHIQMPNGCVGKVITDVLP